MPELRSGRGLSTAYRGVCATRPEFICAARGDNPTPFFSRRRSAESRLIRFPDTAQGAPLAAYLPRGTRHLPYLPGLLADSLGLAPKAPDSNAPPTRSITPARPILVFRVSRHASAPAVDSPAPTSPYQRDRSAGWSPGPNALDGHCQPIIVACWRTLRQVHAVLLCRVSRPTSSACASRPRAVAVKPTLGPWRLMRRPTCVYTMVFVSVRSRPCLSSASQPRVVSRPAICALVFSSVPAPRRASVTPSPRPRSALRRRPALGSAVDFRLRP